MSVRRRPVGSERSAAQRCGAADAAECDPPVRDPKLRKIPRFYNVSGGFLPTPGTTAHAPGRFGANGSGTRAVRAVRAGGRIGGSAAGTGGGQRGKAAARKRLRAERRQERGKAAGTWRSGARDGGKKKQGQNEAPKAGTKQSRRCRRIKTKTGTERGSERGRSARARDDPTGGGGTQRGKAKPEAERRQPQQAATDSTDVRHGAETNRQQRTKGAAPYEEYGAGYTATSTNGGGAAGLRRCRAAIRPQAAAPGRTTVRRRTAGRTSAGHWPR